MATPLVDPAPAADQPAAPPAPEPASHAAPEAKWWITVLQKGTKEGAEDVKKLLESKGLQVTLEPAGDRFNVHVGAYADRRAPQLDRDLAAVRAIQYKGKTFHDAFVEAAKRGQ
jgi:hypothetical protein